jgi:salicylate hydroxylase
MTPRQGQGGNQAIEDAEGFVLFNSPGVTRTSLPDMLKDFDRGRRQRASKIQNHTREVHDRKSPEVIFKDQMYNSTYDGIRKCLSRLNAGKEMIPVQ